jgi:hypothetical protein
MKINSTIFSENFNFHGATDVLLGNRIQAIDTQTSVRRTAIVGCLISSNLATCPVQYDIDKNPHQGKDLWT